MKNSLDSLPESGRACPCGASVKRPLSGKPPRLSSLPPFWNYRPLRWFFKNFPVFGGNSSQIWNYCTTGRFWAAGQGL
jgi:hypothetical protein